MVSQRQAQRITGLSVLALFLWTGALQAQDNPNGWIQTQSWNFLWPLTNPDGAAPTPERMKENWVAPHDLSAEDPKCFDPWDDIDFGGAAAGPGYDQGGLDGGDGPLWLTIGTLEDMFPAAAGTVPTGDLVDYQVMVDAINANIVPLDPGFTALPGDNVLAIATTYVENTGPIVPIDVCTASDDSIQVWINNNCVVNVSASRGSAGDCQEVNPAFLPSGISRITTLVWEGGGGHNFRLALEDPATGDRYADGNGLINFLGPDCPGTGITGQAQYGAVRSVPGVGQNCPPGANIAVTIEGNAPEGSAGGDDDPLVVMETIRAADSSALEITSDGGTVTTIIEPDDGIHLDTGAALEFFVLGPIANAGGAAPGVDVIRQAYLSIPDSDVGTLNEGDSINDVGATSQTVRRIAINNGDALDFNLVGGAGDNIMHYAWTKLTLAADTDLVFGAASDDSVQVLVDDVEVIIHNAGGGFGNFGDAQYASDVISLTAGTHTIVTKTFEGGGGHGVRLLFLRASVPTGGVGPGGADCASATAIAPGEFGIGNTVGAAVGTDCDPQISGAHYYEVEGTGETMTVQTCSSVFLYDTYLAVFDSTCDAAGCVASNDDTCGRQSQVSWDSVAGTTYFIRVYGWDASEGTYLVKVSDTNTPPTGADIGASPLTGAGVCADPAGGCDTEATATTGKQVTWNVTRGALNTGISYDINYTGPGDTTHAGVVVGEATVEGPDTLSFIANQTGPIGAFANSHDIGGPPSVGSTSFDAGTDTYTMSASGEDIWNNGDEFQFAYARHTGDFDASVRITNRVDPVSDGQVGKHGIMARQTCDRNSRYSFINTSLATPGNPIDLPRLGSRMNHLENGSGLEAHLVDDGAMAGYPATGDQRIDRRPEWMRLVRIGQTFHAYLAFDAEGVPGPWTKVGSITHPDMPDEILLGMAITAHTGDTGVQGTISFDNWLVTSVETCPEDACAGPDAELFADDYSGLADGDAPPDGTVVVRAGTFTPQVVGERLRLTENGIGSSANAVWYGDDPVDASDSFTAEFDVYMDAGNLLGDSRCDPALNPDPADGMTFTVIQVGGTGDPLGPWPDDLDLLTLGGDGGGSIGYNAGELRNRTEGHPSFSVEMDNWVGGSANDPTDGGSSGNDCNWHVALNTDGVIDRSLQTNVEFGVATGDLPDIFDSDGVHFKVDYSVASGGGADVDPIALARIDVFVSGIKPDGTVVEDLHVLSACIPALEGDAIFGFTAGTGGATATQEVDDVVVSTCAGGATGVGPFLRGDCNNDGDRNITDAVFQLNYLFLGGRRPECLAACDGDGDGNVPATPTDVVFVLNFQFLGGPSPVEPSRVCARSTRAEDIAIGCVTPLDPDCATP